jgi:hypothetical protein
MSDGRWQMSVSQVSRYKLLMNAMPWSWRSDPSPRRLQNMYPTHDHEVQQPHPPRHLAALPIRAPVSLNSPVIQFSGSAAAWT